MHEIEFGDGTYRHHDEDDLAECRVCHVRPVDSGLLRCGQVTLW